MTDPGWKPVFRLEWMDDEKRTPLVLLRTLWVAVPVGWLLCGAMLPVAAGERAELTWFPVVVLADAIFAGATIAALRTAMVSRAEVAARGVRVLFFVALALSSSPATVGFAGAIVTGRNSTFLIGVACSTLLLWFSAPSAAAIARLDRALRERGSSARALDLLS